jgi:uncharacterized paraquat-inducible protein A
MMENDLDLILGEEEIDGEWYCDMCEHGPMEEEEARCGRCGHKHKHHKDAEIELDEFGEPIDEKYYEEHY